MDASSGVRSTARQSHPRSPRTTIWAALTEERRGQTSTALLFSDHRPRVDCRQTGSSCLDGASAASRMTAPANGRRSSDGSESSPRPPPWSATATRAWVTPERSTGPVTGGGHRHGIASCRLPPVSEAGTARRSRKRRTDGSFPCAVIRGESHCCAWTIPTFDAFRGLNTASLVVLTSSRVLSHDCLAPARSRTATNQIRASRTPAAR